MSSFFLHCFSKCILKAFFICGIIYICIHTCSLLLISMLWHRQAIFKSKGDKLFSSAECRIWTRVFGTKSPADWMPADKPTELSRIKLKTWTQQPVPMISEHSAHSTPLPFGIRTWLWRYKCSLLLISMLWHRQAIFKSKGDMTGTFCGHFMQVRIWTSVGSDSSLSSAPPQDIFCTKASSLLIGSLGRKLIFKF